jgi:lysine 2,3-aminomutase
MSGFFVSVAVYLSRFHRVQYIIENKEIEDVLLSGGDPLLLADKRLDEVLGRIRSEAPHVRFLRIGSRLPVQIPSRITPELVEILERHNVNMLNIHVNHPKEVTPYLSEKLKMLRKAGIMLGNQAVLLKGVNDDPLVLRELCMRMIENGVRPYYVYTCDSAMGNGSFYVSYDRTIEIIEKMRGWMSGPSMPTFVLDGVGGLGKLPIQPDYVTRGPKGEVMLRNYEGKTARALHLEQGYEGD